MLKLTAFLALCCLFTLSIMPTLAQGISTLEHDYDDIGVFHACSYYNLKDFNDLSDLKASTLSLDSKKEIVGGMENERWEFEYLKPSQKVVIDRLDEYEIMVCTPDNKTLQEICVNETRHKVIRKNITVYESVWLDFIKYYDKYAASPTIRNNVKQSVRFCADLDRVGTKNGYEISVDHIPKYNDVLYSKLAWWNSTWIYKRRITVSNLDLVSYPMLINISNTTLSLHSLSPSFADLRFVNETEDGELDYWFEYNTTGAGAYVEVWVETDGNFYVYYGNPDAKYTGDFGNTLSVVGDEIVADTTADYSEFGAGTFTYNATCNTLPSGQAVQCLDITTEPGNDMQAMSDATHTLDNITFVARFYPYNTDSGTCEMRVGTSSTFYGPNNDMYFFNDAGTSQNWSTALRAGAGGIEYSDLNVVATEGHWLRIRISSLWSGADGNFTNWTIRQLDTGQRWTDTRTDSANASIGDKIWLYVYDASGNILNQIDFWFMDQNDPDVSFLIGAEEEIVIPPIPPPIITGAATFCLNDDYLYIRKVLNITQDDVTLLVIERNIFCDYGCSNATLTTLGYPGCIESTFSLALIFIIIVVVIVLVLRWVFLQ